jgi:flagellar biosynthesis/type III secretory pathway protein FliH
VNTYLKLDESELDLFEAELEEAVGKEVVMEVISPWRKQGRTEGIELGKNEGIELGKSQGVQQGKLVVVLQILSQKLGNLSPPLASRLQKLNEAQIDALVTDLLKLNSEQELNEGWLNTLKKKFKHRQAQTG